MTFPPLLLLHIIAGLFLAVASIIDLKTHEVPDFLNFSLITLGLFLGVVASVVQLSWWPVLASLAGAICGYLIAAVMYYGGQWGGGDAKMLIGLGALYGVNIPQLLAGEFSLFLTLVISIFLAGAIYGLVYAAWLTIMHWKAFSVAFRKRLIELKHFRYVVIAASVLLIIIFFTVPLEYKPFFAAVFVIIFIGFYSFVAGKLIEQICMIQKCKVARLVEGDWLVSPVIKDGKVIVKPTKYGLTTEQLQTLREHHIKEVDVKVGIPFIPGFFLGYLVVVVFGNWLPFLLNLFLR